MRSNLTKITASMNKSYNTSFIIIVLLSCTMLIVVNYFTIKTLSATRAYVNGESHYSKGHNIATRNLIYYLITSKEEYWMKFESNLNIPLGDAKARIAMTANASDAIAIEGFTQGKNDPADIGDLIWLFKNFKKLPFFEKAINEWKKGDELNVELYLAGRFIKEKIKNKKLTYDQKLQLLEELDLINTKITINQDAFSNSFGDGTRAIKNYLLIVNTFFIFIIIGAVSYYYGSTIKKLTIARNKLKSQKEKLQSTIADLEKTKINLSTEIIQNKKIIGTISHDIRSPLKYIQVIAKHLTTIIDKNEIAHKYITSIHKSSYQLCEFTKTLVEYSKIYIADKKREQKSYSLFELVENKKVIFEEIAQNYNTKIINTTAQDTFSNINKRIVAIIIHNLLDNAVKNTINGTIEIGALKDNQKTSYYVKDSGSGMGQDIIDYYTNLFNNRDPEKLILSAYGIGLHLVLELVAMLNGKISFTKGDEEGTTVLVEIYKTKQLIDTKI